MINVRSGEVASDQTVVIENARISYVGPAAGAPSPRGARIVDGTGKFLIPGLWDMHIHGFLYVFSDFAGPLMIANGVTGARDMGYYIDTTLRWKRDIAEGKEIGPRLVVGARVDGPINEARFVAHVTTPEDGVRAVDTLARRKDRTARANFINTYSHVPRDAYFALAREAKRIGIPFAGPVPFSVSVAEASDSGQRSIEHEDDLMRACSAKDSLLRATAGDTANLSGPNQLADVREHARLILATYDARKCQAVIATLARNQTWLTPILVSYQPYAHSFDSASTHPELAKYVPGLVKGGWANRAQAVSRSDSAMVRSYFSFDRTRELQAAGVKLLAGTDTPQPFVYPGFSLHDELQLLVKSGLTPLEALQTATYNPAEFFGMQTSLGTVEKGKVADLVLLDANPLTDIANSRRIAAVIANGRLFDRPALAQLLHHVDSALKR
ncbi:MAG TPA: amidohydrolase family protein [Gemmatimonadaceae bacterium]|nr:amidohydrolase family protein [Gemmatimonadaceae bacterium]